MARPIACTSHPSPLLRNQAAGRSGADQALVVARVVVPEETMGMRLLILLSAVLGVLPGMSPGLRAQQTGPAARRVIVFVWDGLRTDDLTPEITPNYFA